MYLLITMVKLGVGSVFLALCWRRIGILMLGLIVSAADRIHQLRNKDEEKSKKIKAKGLATFYS